MPTTRVSAMDQLASPGGTTRDLGINFQQKLIARALAAQQAREGILNSQTQRAELGNERDFRAKLLDLEQSKLNQAGALGFGGLDLQGRGLDLQKTLGEGGLDLQRTGQEADIAFREGGVGRQLEAARGFADIARENRPAKDRFLDSVFEGFLPAGGARAATPGGAAPFAAPAPTLDPATAGVQFGDAPSLQQRPGTAPAPQLEDLVAQDEARKTGELATGARGPGSPLDNLDFGSVRGQLVAQALGLDTGQLKGTRAFERRGQQEQIEDIGFEQVIGQAGAEKVSAGLEEIQTAFLPRVLEASNIGGLSTLGLGEGERPRLLDRLHGKIVDLRQKLIGEGVPEDVIRQTIVSWLAANKFPDDVKRWVSAALQFNIKGQ